MDYMVSLVKSPLANQIGAHLVSGYSFFSEPQVNTRTMPSDYVSFRKIIQYDVLDYVIPIRLLVFLGIIFRTVSRLAEVSVWIPGGDRQRVEASPSKSQVRIPIFHRFMDKYIIIRYILMLLTVLFTRYKYMSQLINYNYLEILGHYTSI